MNAPVVIVQTEHLLLNRAKALEVTGFAPKFFDQMERTGRIRGKRVGRRGEMMYRTAELRAVVDAVYGVSAPTSIDEFFDGLGED